MKKETEKYYFSVEGETEQAYLIHLKDLINLDTSVKKKVSFHIKKRKPGSYVKNLSITEPVNIYHIFDYESQSEFHQQQFLNVFNEMKDVERTMDNRVRAYYSGHTNLTFELWIVLHKVQLNGSKNLRKDYLSDINNSYGENFSRLDEYKHHNAFKRVLSKITINDVREAIIRADMIENINKNRGYQK